MSAARRCRSAVRQEAARRPAPEEFLAQGLALGLLALGLLALALMQAL